MSDLNQPVNVTRVIEFTPDTKYLFMATLEGGIPLSCEHVACMSDQLDTAIRDVLGTDARYKVVITDQPIDLIAYQFKHTEE